MWPSLLCWLCRVSNSLGPDCGVVTPDGCGRLALVSQSQARAGPVDQWEPGLRTGCGDLTWGYPGCPPWSRGPSLSCDDCEHSLVLTQKVLTIFHTYTKKWRKSLCLLYPIKCDVVWNLVFVQWICIWSMTLAWQHHICLFTDDAMCNV